MKQKTRFDLMFHLLGEQRLPVFLGMTHYECLRHVVVHSGALGQTVNLLRRALPSASDIDSLRVDPYDPHAVRQSILALIGEPGDSVVGFNLTGGTKLMFAGAFSACATVSGVPVYFETIDHQAIQLSGEFQRDDVGPIDSVEPFFLLAGFKVIESGRWSENPSRLKRETLTKSLWTARSEVARFYAELVPFNDHPSTPFRIQQGRNCIQLDDDNHATISLRGKTYEQKNWPDLARYITGGWFEEYCYLQLAPLVDSGEIRDLRIGLKIDWDDSSAPSESSGAQEFDLAFTDGYSLYLIECKAGRVKSEHIYGLENHVRHYGGVVAKGALVGVNPPLARSTRRKIRDSSSIAGFFSDGVPQSLPSNALTFLPGEIFT